MKAMILAAGKGTRLGSLTENQPKVLLDINGKSMLQMAVEKCTASGFDDIIINVHHFADMVEAEIKRLIRQGFKIAISDERDQLLETGGGLYKARTFFGKEPFLLYNADIITDIDITLLLEHHRKGDSLATLAVRHRPGVRYLLVDREWRLRGWCNKATGERIITGGTRSKLKEIAFSSIHIINPEIFRYMSDGVYTMTALYLQLAAEHKISALLMDEGYWFNTGTTEILEEVREKLRTMQ